MDFNLRKISLIFTPNENKMKFKNNFIYTFSFFHFYKHFLLYFYKLNFF